jgi:serine/threonine-protein kinase
VKVLDFGIVRAVHEMAEPTPVHTRENTVLGTPAFIAPEQALAGPVDARTDIYATGCVAYWLLTGEVVFTADSAMAMIMKHAQERPAPPSTRTERPIPQPLEDLVLSCLAKDPADRPQSARELSRRLAALPGAGAWTQEHARAWWTMNEVATAT